MVLPLDDRAIKNWLSQPESNRHFTLIRSAVYPLTYGTMKLVQPVRIELTTLLSENGLKARWFQPLTYDCIKLVQVAGLEPAKISV